MFSGLLVAAGTSAVGTVVKGDGLAGRLGDCAAAPAAAVVGVDVGVGVGAGVDDDPAIAGALGNVTGTELDGGATVVNVVDGLIEVGAFVPGMGFGLAGAGGVVGTPAEDTSGARDADGTGLAAPCGNGARLGL
jgi:hypothetical protein